LPGGGDFSVRGLDNYFAHWRRSGPLRLKTTNFAAAVSGTDFVPVHLPGCGRRGAEQQRSAG
jgi:hypothetical protein